VLVAMPCMDACTQTVYKNYFAGEFYKLICIGITTKWIQNGGTRLARIAAKTQAAAPTVAPAASLDEP